MPEPVAYGYQNERLGWYGLSLQPGGSYTAVDRRSLYSADQLTAAVLAERERQSTVLERIEVKAQAGLCYFTLESAREFLKDIRDEVADALQKERPRR